MIIGIRHAPVAASMSGKCYGSSNVDTQLSHARAAEMALGSLRALGDGALQFDSIWSSDLIRCRGLAGALAPALPVPAEIYVDERLRELDHGSFEGRAWDDIHAKEPEALHRWGTHWRTEGPPGGESAKALQQRVNEWLDGLDMTHRHLLIGHAGVMRALLVLQQGLDWTDAMATEIAHLEAVRLS